MFPFPMPLPLKLLLIASLSALTFALGGFAAWNWQAASYGKEIAELKLESERDKNKGLTDALTQVTTWKKAQDDAIKKSESRAAAAVASANRADGESKRLQQLLSDANASLATASADAVRRYAATANAVLAECGNALTGMAKEAQRNLDATMKLQESWPQ